MDVQTDGGTEDPLNAMPRTTLRPDDRHFLGQVGRAVFMNVFSEERDALLAALFPGQEDAASRLDPSLYSFLK